VRLLYWRSEITDLRFSDLCHLRSSLGPHAVWNGEPRIGRRNRYLAGCNQNKIIVPMKKASVDVLLVRFVLSAES
jgi:hypothetical protein